jgi:adenine phosphoribosyltransferase
LGIEARGFIFAPTLAYAMGAGFIPVRKPNKLPAKTIRETYQLEYGTDSLEIHADAIQPGQNVLIVDDLLATGGTAAAVGRLVEKLGGKVVGFGFVVELDFLKGRDKLPGYNVFSLLHYDK